VLTKIVNNGTLRSGSSSSAYVTANPGSGAEWAVESNRTGNKGDNLTRERAFA
jgi:hypothetical protein